MGEEDFPVTERELRLMEAIEAELQEAIKVLEERAPDLRVPELCVLPGGKRD